MGFCEIDKIDNGNICIIAVNPREYSEKLKNKSINKKHKGVRRDTVGMNFESYAERINTLRNTDSERAQQKLVQKRLQVKNTEMKITSINKVQVTNLNDKRYYFLHGIVYLTLGHPLLSELHELKKSYPKIYTVSEKEKRQIIKTRKSSCCKK